MKKTTTMTVGLLILSQAVNIGAVTMSYDEGTPCSYSLSRKHISQRPPQLSPQSSQESLLDSSARHFGQGRVASSAVSRPIQTPVKGATASNYPCSTPECKKDDPSTQRETVKPIRQQSDQKEQLGKRKKMEAPVYGIWHSLTTIALWSLVGANFGYAITLSIKGTIVGGLVGLVVTAGAYIFDR